MHTIISELTVLKLKMGYLERNLCTLKGYTFMWLEDNIFTVLKQGSGFFINDLFSHVHTLFTKKLLSLLYF